MDEEEKVVQRKPRAKFTLDHLQHAALGLDEVYENFQGYFESKPLQHGREGQDLTRLLCLYQNWQKNLYPYCSFDVFIQKLEAMGHTKECQKLLQQYRQRTKDALRMTSSLPLNQGDRREEELVDGQIPGHERAKDAQVDDVLDSIAL